MTIEEINEVVRQVLHEIQSSSGRPVPIFNDELRPIGDLEGFDSLNAVEAASLLSEYLGNEIPNNIMLPTYPGEQLTVSEIVSRLYQFINS